MVLVQVVLVQLVSRRTLDYYMNTYKVLLLVHTIITELISYVIVYFNVLIIYTQLMVIVIRRLRMVVLVMIMDYVMKN